ncbi:MAG: hypothetical protein HDR88_06465 [Bacteroides sp.]|nr:hypothetical protein [Bacteroides sp.]
MNKNIINSLLVGASALALASCGENSWNDLYLKGFEGGVDYENAVTGSYTLTADDYKAISKLMEEKATTDEQKAEAKAIATNCYFNKYGAFPASVALPPFMETAAFPYYLGSNGSVADISYAEASEVPAELTAISGATEYTVSADDYKNAWGSDEDYISAFAPMTSAANKLPGILRNALPDATEGSYAIVRYNESETNPIFISNSEIEEFMAGTYYFVADGNKGAMPLAETYTYGYLKETDVTVSDGIVNTDVLNGFSFVGTDGGFYIIDTYGRYLYQDDSHNSFNVSVTLPEAGAVWTVTLASNGLATITNTLANKWIQYDPSYSSWGSYDSDKGSLPVLYKAPDPAYYMIAEDSHGAGPLAEDKSYGYLPVIDMTVNEGIVAADPANAFTFVATDGGYYIKDSFGRYLYQAGTYNSFNVAAEIPESGAVWSVARDSEGLATITNTEVSKWIQYDSSYTSWGSYNTENGLLPKLYRAATTAAKLPAKVVAGTPVSTSINAVYYFDGSEWAIADGVSALNPADYEAMGVDNAKLTDPEVYIPLYLKNKLIYAQSGDQQIVVYNYNKADLFVYDGAAWTLNNNGLEDVVGRFTKANSAWSFTKYIGKAIFDLFHEDQIIRDRSYLLVHDNICATAIDKGSNYGYINVSSVEISGETIVLSSDAYAYTFASSVTVGDAEYKAPEGQFLMRDSNNRYLYMSGTYNSFNIKDTPTVTDGAVDSVYLWTAERQPDGTWQIKNVGAGQDRIWGYSISHSSFGAYDSMNETRVLPVLYIMGE